MHTIGGKLYSALSQAFSLSFPSVFSHGQDEKKTEKKERKYIYALLCSLFKQRFVWCLLRLSPRAHQHVAMRRDVFFSVVMLDLSVYFVMCVCVCVCVCLSLSLSVEAFAFLPINAKFFVAVLIVFFLGAMGLRLFVSTFTVCYSYIYVRSRLFWSCLYVCIFAWLENSFFLFIALLSFLSASFSVSLRLS